MASAADTAARLSKLLANVPDLFRQGKNMGALFGAIAQSDADLQNLFIDVKQQLFVNTASGSYLDMLGANVGVTRPDLIGMVDDDFRQFIKLQTYYPKQIRQLLFQLMELFYGTDTIKANIQSTVAGPYSIIDGSTLTILVDGQTEVDVTFNASSFNDPTNVTADEIAAQINTQTQEVNLFATTYYNAIDKQEFVQIYTDTYGPVGSIQVTGGTANQYLKFPNTLRNGTTIATQYRIIKNSQSVDLYWAGGDDPLFSELQAGDSVILTGTPFLPGNIGSFPLTNFVDTGVPALILPATSATLVATNVVQYAMASTTGVVVGKEVIVSGFSKSDNNGTFVVSEVTSSYIQVVSPRTTSADDETTNGSVDLLPNASYVSFSNPAGQAQATFGVATTNDVLFFRPVKKKLESAQRPATIWEINSNEIVVTLPATPVIIRRGLAGSAHMQGSSAVVTNAFATSINVASPEYFPEVSGRFYLQSPDGYVDTTTPYTYALQSNGQLLNVLPQPYPMGDQLLLGVGPLSATNGSNIITVTTIEPHGLTSGELVRLVDFDGFAGLTADHINGTISVVSVVSPVAFTVNVAANATSTTTNAPAFNKGQVFTTHNMKVQITNIQSNSGYVGSYVYDPLNAKYTISQVQTTLQQDLELGAFGDSIQVFDSTVFQNSSGQVVINYGRADEEGPITYIAKPSTSSIFIDPSYRYKSAHSSGAAINLLASPLATTPDQLGSQFPVYTVDTITPRSTLQTLLTDAAAAGVSITFVVVLPDNLYNAFTLYEAQS